MWVSPLARLAIQVSGSNSSEYEHDLVFDISTRLLVASVIIDFVDYDGLSTRPPKKAHKKHKTKKYPTNS